MKAKVKFDKNQLKSFAIEHVEKFVFGGMAVVALLLCWSALGRKPYSGVPGDLTKKADGVKTRIAQSTPPEPLPDLPAKRDLNRMLHSALIAVNPSFFPMSEIARPYADLKVRRTQPTLLTVQDPKATAGFGAIAMSEKPLGRDRFATLRDGPRLMDDPMGGGMAGMDQSMMDPAMMAGAANAMPTGMMGAEYGQQMMQQQQAMEAQQMAGMSGMPEGYGDPAMMMGPQARRRTKKPPKKPIEKKPKPKVVQEVEKMALEVPGGAKLEGRYWVSVVGLIPSWDQEGEYEKVFREATKRLRTDVPQYVYCDVERAVVLSPGEIGDYEVLDMDWVVEDMEKWAAVYPDMIDKKYLSPSVDVTAPLPPLVLANHNPDAIRHPKIPLAGEASVEENKAAAAAAMAEEAEAKSKPRRRGGARVRPGMGGPGMMPGMGGMMNGAVGLPKEKIEYQLFRFFDFKVEPGKTYKYRVRLALDNPNSNVEPQYLQSPDLAKEEFVYTDWSEPTPEVFVPLGSELLAGDINPKEPAAKIMVRQFDPEKAVTAVHEFDLGRGDTANADGIEVPLPKTGPATGSVVAAEPVKEKVDFRTDATMVDLVGGERLVGGPSGTKAPGRMLVMRSDGELALLSDATKKTNEKKKKGNLHVPPTTRRE